MTQWNAQLYDDKHQFISNFGGNLVSLLQPTKGEQILDVGCGTGDLAFEIAKSGATVIGIDAASSMIEKALEKYPDCTFHVEDAESFHFPTPFDAVFSNAAMHWMKNQQQVISNCYTVLRNGGRFVAELGGANNIQAITNAIKEASTTLQLPYKAEQFPWVFPTKEEMTEMLTNAGFQIVAIEHYERPTPLVGEDGIRNWLMMFSNNLLKHLTDTEKETLYAECEAILRPQLYHDGTWTADYWRLRFVAVK
ncbi:class I SAM-dependent methyltransferase [Lysinibacillus sp. LZ02]|uniref:class I SAM-dependent methyltransferase n=1 Tax=Lysinibacillus sp. LZ02 TaxID=3420668 RepID=UPI003D3608F8